MFIAHDHQIQQAHSVGQSYAEKRDHWEGFVQKRTEKEEDDSNESKYHGFLQNEAQCSRKNPRPREDCASYLLKKPAYAPADDNFVMLSSFVFMFFFVLSQS